MFYNNKHTNGFIENIIHSWDQNENAYVSLSIMKFHNRSLTWNTHINQLWGCIHCLQTEDIQVKKIIVAISVNIFLWQMLSNVEMRFLRKNASSLLMKWPILLVRFIEVSGKHHPATLSFKIWYAWKMCLLLITQGNEVILEIWPCLWEKYVLI